MKMCLNFVKVMPIILLVPFFPDTVYTFQGLDWTDKDKDEDKESRSEPSRTRTKNIDLQGEGKTLNRPVGPKGALKDKIND